MWRGGMDTGHENWWQQGMTKMKLMILVYLASYITRTSIWHNWKTLSLLRIKGRCQKVVVFQLLCKVLKTYLLSLQQTFKYDSDFWKNKNEFNLPGGETGFDSQETKLPTYWETPLSKICLGMKYGQQVRFVVIDKQADSLYSLIADGQHRLTSLSREKWKSLIGPEASLQPHCNTEGFNAVGTNSGMAKARIGIVANQENDCNSCDSRIGFGTGGYPDDSNACGNEAIHAPDNGDKHIKAFGYILVQWEERTPRL